MIHEQSARVTPGFMGKNVSSSPANAGRCRMAIEQLHSAFTAPRPLVILAGHWASDRSHITRNFLAGVQSDIAFLRVDKSCSDALQGMRQVIHATGLEPHNMSLAELDSMFENFLSYQLAQRRRTILLIEESHDDNSWVRDKVRQFVALESERRFGLMIVLFRPISRKPKANGHAGKPGTAPAADQPPKVLRFTTLLHSSGAEVGSMSVVENIQEYRDDGAPLKMILIHNGKTLREMTMEQPRMMIGSAEDNDICIKDSTVNRYHALLVRFGDTAFVTDLNSKNGTYINMSRIQDQMVIHQDILSIGNHRIKFINS